jgi:hypothetical protein
VFSSLPFPFALGSPLARHSLYFDPEDLVVDEATLGEVQGEHKECFCGSAPVGYGSNKTVFSSFLDNLAERVSGKSRDADQPSKRPIDIQQGLQSPQKEPGT